MWFMNKIANPFVRLILRSPLHGMLSAALLLITYRGLKSGKAFTLPVQYVQDGSSLYIVPGAPEKKTWWRNLKDGAPVQLTLRGQTLTGHGILLKQDTDAETIVKTFGLYLQRFPTLAKVHGVRAEADGRFNVQDVRKTAESLVMIQVALNKA